MKYLPENATIKALIGRIKSMAEQGFESGIRLPVSTLLTLLAMIIAGGVGYGSLRTEVDILKEHQASMSLSLTSISEKLDDLKTSVIKLQPRKIREN